MSGDHFVTCETTAAIVVHIRKIGSRPVNLNGHTEPRPLTLCGKPAAWDTQIPPEAAACKSCLSEWSKP